LRVEAKPPEVGNFSWKDFYISEEVQLKEVLIKDKVVYYDSPDGFSTGRANTASKIGDLVRDSLKERHTHNVFIDEAQHFCKIASGRKLVDQMDIIKSIANQSEVLYILFGTYDLMAMLNLNGQLARRIIAVHFPRYHYNQVDLKEFYETLVGFEQRLPLAERSHLMKHQKYIYQNSLGCVGVLKEWLTRCLTEAINTESKKITEEILKKNALSQSSLLKMAEEIERGEREYQELMKSQEAKIAAYLGMPSSKKTPPKTDDDTSKKGNQHPGERNPKRDSTDKPPMFAQS